MSQFTRAFFLKTLKLWYLNEKKEQPLIDVLIEEIIGNETNWVLFFSNS